VEEAVRRYLEERGDRQVTLTIRLPEDIKKRLDERKHEPPCLSLIDTEIHIYERQFKIVEELLKPKDDSRRKMLRSKQV